MFQHLIIQVMLYLSSGRLREVKNKREFQTFSSKSGYGSLTRGGRLQEILNIVIVLKTFGILENWSLRRVEVVATGGSAVGSYRRVFTLLSQDLL